MTQYATQLLVQAIAVLRHILQYPSGGPPLMHSEIPTDDLECGGPSSLKSA